MTVGGNTHDHDDMLHWTDGADRVRSLREQRLESLETEAVPIDRLADRILADDLEAPADRPAHSHATMDGFAFAAADDYPLEIVDTVYPEDAPAPIEPGQAVRIATGAPLPAGATAVLKREAAIVTEAGGEPMLEGPRLEPGTYVYERGSNVRAGEMVYRAGEQLSARDALLLGDLGFDSIPVRERWTVALLATGTEIHEDRQRDLDTPMLAGLVRRWGGRVTIGGSVPDAYERVETRIAELAATHDVIMTTGGTSVGKKDHVIRALDSLGDVLFHRVRLRPGKPIAVARLDDHDAVAFAIPGKPIGAHLVTTLVARPFFLDDRHLPTIPARMAVDVGIATSGFTYGVPVAIDAGRAIPLGHRSSPLRIYEETFDPSVLSSSTRASRADGFVLTETALTAGETVDVIPYRIVDR